MNTILVAAMILIKSTAPCAEEKKEMVKCTIKFRKSEVTLTAEECLRVKDLFEGAEKKSKKSGTTDAKIGFNLPNTEFIFTAANAPTVKFLCWDHEEPFTIQVATGDNKIRRVFLEMKISEKR